MTTQTAKIEFRFEEGTTQTALANIQRKVATLQKNADYDSTAAFFVEHTMVTAIVSFDQGNSYKFFDKMNSALTRLINTHKQDATYQWSL